MAKREKKVLSLRIDDSMQQWLAENWKTKAEGAEAALNAFYSIYRASLAEIAGTLSRAELSIILDVLNGTFLTAHLIGCHLALEVADGIALNGYGEKWGVDREFPARLAALPRAHAAALELWAADLWQHCDDLVYLEEQISRMAKPE